MSPVFIPGPTRGFDDAAADLIFERIVAKKAQMPGRCGCDAGSDSDHAALGAERASGSRFGVLAASKG